MTIFEKMEAMAKSYEERARGLRLAIVELQGEAKVAARQALPGRLNKALSLRSTANDNNGNGHTPVVKKKGKLAKGEFSRTVQAVLRAHEGPMDIQTLKAKLTAAGVKKAQYGIGAMVRYNYIKEVADGYVLGKHIAEEANP